MSELKIHLFGYPHLFVDEQPIAVGRRKTLALAAYLALESVASDRHPLGEKVRQSGSSREALSTLLWAESSQQQAGAYLRQALWDLSKSIGETWLVREGPWVGFNPQERVWVDVIEFELALESWKAGVLQPREVVPRLEQAASLYREGFLAGFSLRDSPAFDAWQTEQGELLGLHISNMLEILAQYHLRQQAWDKALEFARRWLELDTFNEAAHRIVMQICSQTGQRAAAIQQYQRCSEILRSELGLLPAPETTALYERIKASTPPAPPAETPAAAAAPTGTVTFLFTDIEGSTRLWERYPNAMPQAFKRHEAILRQSMLAHGGYVYKMIGDAFQVAFSTAAAALAAAIDAQRSLKAEPWGEIGELRVRMALHTGVTEERGDDYVGPELNRAARIMSAGHGGQVLVSQTTAELVSQTTAELVSQATAELVRSQPGEGVSLLDLGEHRLRDLEKQEHIYQVGAASLTKDFPALRTLDSPTQRLPAMATPFVGRKRELEQLESLLTQPDCRLITLLGIGGSGKTRLAIQAASVSQAYRQQACFVPLAASHSRDEMILTIAQALDFKFQALPEPSASEAGIQGQLFQFLAGKHILLVLDNFEQLIGCADFIAELMQAAEHLKLIVTSRERLNLPGEWVIEVMGLSFPANFQVEKILDYPAVQLFTNSAQRVSGVQLASEDIPAIVRICQVLEGVPLGLEMAASWVKMLSCAEIANEIERDLDFLSTSWRGMPERHRTLRAVFDHSWDLLGERERDGFIQLAVFRGGFSRQAAWEVAGTSILLLAGLTDKSFLRRVSDGRYDIHPVLSGYVREKLAANPDFYHTAQELHGRYFSGWLCGMAEELKGPRQLTALTALRVEMHNLQAALEWLVDQRVFTHLEEALPGLVLFSTMNDQRVFTHKLMEILTRLKDALEATGQQPALLALVYAILRYYSSYPSRTEQSNRYGRRSLELFAGLPDSRLKAYGLALNCIGPTYTSVSDTLALGQACLQLFRSLRDDWGTALLQLILGDTCCFGTGDLAQARGYYESSVWGFLTQENQWGVSICYYGLMEVEKRDGNLELAYQYGWRAKELYEQMESTQRTLFVNGVLSEIALQLDKVEVGRKLLSDNIEVTTRLGDQESRRYYQERLAQLDLKTHPA